MTSAINTALMRLAPRAETNDPATLVATFVDAGPLFTLLSSRNHQVLYGRRGTGKTHALYYLREHARKSGDHAVYVDLRQLGSSGGLYADSAIDIRQRATRLLVDTLLAVSNGVYDEILAATVREPDVLEPALSALSELSDCITQVRVAGPITREIQSTVQTQQSASESISATLASKPSVGVEVKDATSQGATVGLKRTEAGQEEQTIHFGSTVQAMSKLLKALPGKRLWVLLDEWSVVPLELQPLLADLIRRCMLPVRDLVVKIAAIEQRSRFLEVTASGYLGIELGADMSADVDFDDFMVFENDADRAKAFFADLIFRHVKQEHVETSGPSPEIASLKDAADLVSKAFTQRTAFDELVRAAEGVPRDAMHIASLAAQRAVNDVISVPHIRVAARKWYQRDKEKTVSSNPGALKLLHWIHEQVINKRRARACLVRQDEGRMDPMLRLLFDARVLHVLKRGVSGGDVPGVRFDVYALDYGCYVELVSTKVAPVGLLGDDAELAGEVPRDDYRSLRRAILDLDEFRASLGP